MPSQPPTKEELETRLANALAEVDGLREQLGSAQVEIRLLRAMHLPLCRQAQQMERDSGYAPSRSMLSDCLLEAGASLRLAKEAMKVELCTGGYIQADETRVPVQVRTKEGVNHTGKFLQYSRQGPRGVRLPNGPWPGRTPSVFGALRGNPANRRVHGLRQN